MSLFYKLSADRILQLFEKKNCKKIYEEEIKIYGRSWLRENKIISLHINFIKYALIFFMDFTTFCNYSK